jgi:uncharacterized protein (DUF58 family)
MPIDKQHIANYSKIELLAKQVVEGFITGLHKSPFHGFSVEFAEHRLYNTGESTKHIDWKLYGRTDKLFVKRYEEETNLRCQIIIDASSSMYFPVKLKEGEFNKLTFSAIAAAAISEILRKQRDAVGLSIFKNSLEVNLPAKNNPAHNAKVFSELEKLTEVFTEKNLNATTEIIQNLHIIAETTHKRSLVILFSDMFDKIEDSEALFSALQHLKHNKHEVILFHVCDYAKEIDFNFENKPYQFIDLETGEKVSISGNAVKGNYKKTLRAFQEELKLKAGAFKIDFIEADINLGFNQILQTYLLKRQQIL